MIPVSKKRTDATPRAPNRIVSIPMARAATWIMAAALSSTAACSREEKRAPTTIAVASASSVAAAPAASLPADLAAMAASISKKALEQAAGSAEATPPSVTGTFLGSFTGANIAAVAAQGAEPGLSWRIAEWKARPSSVVALSYRAVPFGSDGAALRPRVAVVESQQGKLARVAGGTFATPRANCANTGGGPDGEPPSFELDLAPYVVAQGNTAIGVRFTCHNSFPAGEGSDTHLVLLEVRGADLRAILDERVASSNHDRVGAVDTTRKGVVSMQSTAHGGYFDLLIRTTTTPTKFSDEDDGTTPATSKEKPRLESKRFVWSGEGYKGAAG